jgi:hypothetical protein
MAPQLNQKKATSWVDIDKFSTKTTGSSMIMRSFSVLLSVPYAIFMPVTGRYNAAGRSAVGPWI